MTISLKNADIMIDAAFAEGIKNKFKPLTAVVLDCGGHIIALKRQDGASLLRPDIALGKAWGALGLGVSSRDIQNMAKERPTFVDSLIAMSNGKCVPAAGGVLIGNQQGELVGAMGITGDLSDHDEQCVMAGIQAAGFSVFKN